MTQLSLEAASWPESALGQALAELCRRTGLHDATAVPQLPSELANAEHVDRWLPVAAEHIGVQVDGVDCTYLELRDLLSHVGPALIRLDDSAGRRYLAVVCASRCALEVLTPARERCEVSIETVRAQLTRELEVIPSKRTERIFSAAGIQARRASRAREALMGLYLSESRIGGIWLLRADPGASFASQLRTAGVFQRAALTLLVSLGQVGATVYGWLLLGSGALRGEIASGWLWAWVALCVSSIPLQVATTWLGGRSLHEVAVLLKRRLLCGALRLAPDRIRNRGSGRLLAMVFESEAIESAGIGGAFSAVLSLLQLMAAGAILSLGVSGGIEAALLGAWIVGLTLLFVRAYRLRVRWTEQRFALANGFVENVIGHRTRVAQQPAERWHIAEDQQLNRYLATSRTLDRAQRSLLAVPARGFFVLSICGLLPALLVEHTSSEALAISVGGILQAYAAFGGLAASGLPLLSGLVAWRQLGELYHAAAQPLPAGDPALAAGTRSNSDASPPREVLQARNVSFRYGHAARPVVRDCSLTLEHGDRVLLEGPSGGGKSTFVALLAGLHAPESGQIFLRGLDRATLGASGWRRRVASAPQFHENHVLSGSLAFNLLMSRAWPPKPEDLAEAEALCRELGLGPTLDRMPAGLQQIIGETGWQLSHGERSRLFLARALLQNAEVVILDESFGALDPVTLRECMACVRRRAPALVVIAHP